MIRLCPNLVRVPGFGQRISGAGLWKARLNPIVSYSSLDVAQGRHGLQTLA